MSASLAVLASSVQAGTVLHTGTRFCGHVLEVLTSTPMTEGRTHQAWGCPCGVAASVTFPADGVLDLVGTVALL